MVTAQQPITRSELREDLQNYATKSDLRAELQNYATKADLRAELQNYATKSDLRAEIAELETRLTRWMIGVLIGSTVAASAICHIDTNVDR